MNAASPTSTVLVVEDEPDLRDAMAEYLALEGYAVMTAANGQEGLNVLSAMHEPCLVLLDLMMPVMDGYGFLEHLRADAWLSTLPVLMVTAHPTAVPPAGTVGLLRKPMQMNDLLATVARHCPRGLSATPALPR